MDRPRHAALARLGLAAVAGSLGTGALGAFGGRPLDNGVSALPPATAAARSEAALAKVDTFVLTGSVSRGAARIGLHVESTARGARLEAALTSNSKAVAGFTGTMQVVRTGGKLYLKGSASFWTSAVGSTLPAKTLAAFKNHWIELPAAEAKSITASLVELTGPGQLAKQLLGSATGASFTRGRPTVVRGKSALPITSTKDGGGTIYIALDGQPLPIEVVGRATADRGLVVFSYPASLAIAAPAGAETLTEVEQSGSAGTS